MEEETFALSSSSDASPGFDLSRDEQPVIKRLAIPPFSTQLTLTPDADPRESAHKAASRAALRQPRPGTGTSSLSMNFGKRGILDSVEKVAWDLLGQEASPSGTRGPRLRPTRPQAASGPSCRALPGPRPPLAPPPSTGPNFRARLSRIPRFHMFGDITSAPSTAARWRGEQPVRSVRLNLGTAIPPVPQAKAAATASASAGRRKTSRSWWQRAARLG